MQGDSVERLKTTTAHSVQLILSVTGWAVTLTVVVLTKWDTLPNTLKYIIVGFISLSFLVSLVLGLIPAVRSIRRHLHRLTVKRQQRLVLYRLDETLKEATLLLESDRTSSLRNHMNSLCNDLVQHKEIHNQLKSLIKRLDILANWHWSLLAFGEARHADNMSFMRQIRAITSFYREIADVVGEFSVIELPSEMSVRSHSDYGRMAKDRYNQHMGRVERLLEGVQKVCPDFYTGGFYRF